MFLVHYLMLIGLFYTKTNLFNILWHWYSCYFWLYYLTHTGTDLSRAFQKLSQLSNSELCSLRRVYIQESNPGNIYSGWGLTLHHTPETPPRERVLTVYFIPNYLVHDSAEWSHWAAPGVQFASIICPECYLLTGNLFPESGNVWSLIASNALAPFSLLFSYPDAVNITASVRSIIKSPL